MLRLTVFLVMLMWTLDKLVNPAHGAGGRAGFCSNDTAESLVALIGLAELVLIVPFVLGLLKRWT